MRKLKIAAAAALCAALVAPIPAAAQKSADTLRLAFRDYGDNKRNDVGFRIARYAQ